MIGRVRLPLAEVEQKKKVGTRTHIQSYFVIKKKAVIDEVDQMWTMHNTILEFITCFEHYVSPLRKSYRG